MTNAQSVAQAKTLSVYGKVTGRGSSHDGNRVLLGKVLVDNDIYEELKDVGLAEMNAQGHIGFWKDGKTHYLHRYVSQPAPGEIVHHINGEIRDNRRANLANMEKGAHTTYHNRLAGLRPKNAVL